MSPEYTHGPRLRDRVVWLCTLVVTVVLSGVLWVVASLDLADQRREVSGRVGEVAESLAAQLSSTAASGSAIRDHGVLGGLRVDPLLLGVRYYPAAAGEPEGWERGDARQVFLDLKPEIGQAFIGGHTLSVREVPLPGGPAMVAVVGDLSSVSRAKLAWLSRSVRTLLVTCVLAYVFLRLSAARLLYPLERLVQVAHAGRPDPTSSDLPEVQSLGGAILGLQDHLEHSRAMVARLRDNLELEKTAREEVEGQVRSAAAEREVEFLSNVSHEIRTPLNAIMGMTAILAESDLEESQQRLLGQVRESGENLLGIVEGVLGLTRIVPGQAETEVAPLDPAELLERIAAKVCGRALDGGLETVVRIDPDVPACVMGDAGLLEQSLLHLADNAVKFTACGGVEFGLVVEEKNGSRVTLRFSVKDTGIGMNAETQQLVLSGFTPADRSSTKRFGGLGLGMAFCQAAARAMGGVLELESEVESGSEVSLSLTTDLGPGHGRTPTPLSTDLAGCKVLAVTANPVLRSAMEHEFEALDVDLNVEQSAYGALEVLNGPLPPDLILLDGEAPGTDELLDGVRSSATPPPRGVIELALEGKFSEAEPEPPIVGWMARPFSRASLTRAMQGLVGDDNPGVHQRASDLLATQDQRSIPLLDTALRKRARILLVEDNVVNQQLVQRILERRGFYVEVASDGWEGVDAFAAREFDLVLMDCQMPEVDGVEAARRIRSIEEGAEARVPIVAMTANTLPEDRARCFEAGMDDYLSKPVRPSEFVSIVESWLSRSLLMVDGERTSRVEAAKPIEVAEVESLPGPLPSEPEEVPSSGERSGSSSSPVLEAGFLTELLDDSDPAGRELARELIEAFLGAAPGTLESLRSSVEEGDWKECARVAHHMVSSCGTVGALRFATLLRRVEATCREDEGADAVRLLEAAEPELSAVLLALQSL